MTCIAGTTLDICSETISLGRVKMKVRHAAKRSSLYCFILTRTYNVGRLTISLRNFFANLSNLSTNSLKHQNIFTRIFRFKRIWSYNFFSPKPYVNAFRYVCRKILAIRKYFDMQISSSFTVYFKASLCTSLVNFWISWKQVALWWMSAFWSESTSIFTSFFTGERLTIPWWNNK